MVNPSIQFQQNGQGRDMSFYQVGVLGVIEKIRTDSHQLVNLNQEYKGLLSDLQGSEFVQLMKGILKENQYQ